jgi:hypothetical protein
MKRYRQDSRIDVLVSFVAMAGAAALAGCGGAGGDAAP